MKRGRQRQGEGTPEIVGGCAELVAVESWRVGDAPTLSSTQRAARNKNLNRRVPLVLERVTWLVIRSCVVRLRRCCGHVVEGKRGKGEEALLWGRGLHPRAGGAVDSVHT